MNYKSTLYKIHRIVGICVVIPTILWVLSGIMHPFMAHWFKPSIPKSEIESFELPIQTMQRIDSICLKNNITDFENIHFIKLNQEFYFQFQLNQDSNVYVNAKTERILDNGELIYAKSLAQYFLDDPESNIQNVEKITHFTDEYKEVNRYLPVWKISFDRDDKIDVYVETSSSKLATFNTTSRKIFIWIFGNFHTWEIFSKAPQLQKIFILISSGFIFIMALSGLIIYAFAWKKFSKQNIRNSRKSHRMWGISSALFMFMFSFSGFYHAYSEHETSKEFPKPRFSVSDFQDLNLSELTSKRITSLDLCKIENKNTFRIGLKGDKKPQYFTFSGNEIQNGDEKLALEIAKKLHQKPDSILEKTLITKFEGEYGFVNKRLPVYKIMFQSPLKETYYIETRTSKLASKVNNSSRKEGYSFAFLHKFHFLDGLGKNTRDIVSMLAAFSLLIVAVKGLKVFLKK